MDSKLFQGAVSELAGRGHDVNEKGLPSAFIMRKYLTWSPFFLGSLCLSCSLKVAKKLSCNAKRCVSSDPTSGVV